MDRNPDDDANRKAKRDMHEAVDKVIDEKKKEPIGTKEAEEAVAADLNVAAQTDTKKRRQSRKKADAANGPHIRTGMRCVTQITVVEADPEKQADALSVMTERARFMAHQPGFISISVHRSLDGRRIVNYVQWQSRELLQAAHKSPEFRREWSRFDNG
jgi:heme-degrading monooxygenase HmoA